MRTDTDWYHDFPQHVRDNLVKTEAFIRKECQDVGLGELISFAYLGDDPVARIDVEDTNLQRMTVMLEQGGCKPLGSEEYLRLISKMLQCEAGADTLLAPVLLPTMYRLFLCDMDRHICNLLGIDGSGKGRYKLYPRRLSAEDGRIHSVVAVRTEDTGFPRNELEIDVRIAPGDMGYDFRFFELVPGLSQSMGRG